jgi:Na+-translocating ferredoxin:NAD+ oxidoreductase RnfE subunit
MSYRKMTRPERKRHIRRKYFENRVKIFVLASFVIILVILVTAFAWSLRQSPDPVIPVLIFAGIVVTVMLGLLFVDIVFWESE